MTLLDAGNLSIVVVVTLLDAGNLSINPVLSKTTLLVESRGIGLVFKLLFKSQGIGLVLKLFKSRGIGLMLEVRRLSDTRKTG